MRHQSAVMFAAVMLVIPLIAADVLGEESKPNPFGNTLRSEPNYANDQQFYCLLSFALPAETDDSDSTLKVWAVVDGDHLYLDLNSNGDLTEENEHFRGDEKYEIVTGFADDALHDRYTDLQARWYSGGGRAFLEVSALVDGEYRFKTAQDQQTLGAKPQEAPLIEFADDLELFVIEKPKFRFWNGNFARTILPLTVVVGTESSTEHFATVVLDSLPDGVHPVASIEYPPRKPGGEPEADEVALERRDTDSFIGTASVSQRIKPGPVKVTVAMPSWKKVEVRPASVKTELPEFKDLPVVGPKREND